MPASRCRPAIGHFSVTSTCRQVYSRRVVLAFVVATSKAAPLQQSCVVIARVNAQQGCTFQGYTFLYPLLRTMPPLGWHARDNALLEDWKGKVKMPSYLDSPYLVRRTLFLGRETPLKYGVVEVLQSQSQSTIKEMLPLSNNNI